MQFPVLRDGVVVNVVEMSPDCIAGTKADVKHAMRAEDAEYQTQVAAWQEAVQAHRAEFDAANSVAERAAQAADFAKRKAAEGKGNAQQLLDHVLATDRTLQEHIANVQAIGARPLPSRPLMVRATRWMIPEGCVLGEPGGNIGETWDGKRYVRHEPLEADPVVTDRISNER
jgi:hypothetical protein